MFSTVEELKVIVKNNINLCNRELLTRWGERSLNLNFYGMEYTVFYFKYMELKGTVRSNLDVLVRVGDCKASDVLCLQMEAMKSKISIEDVIQGYIDKAFEYIFKDIQACAKYISYTKSYKVDHGRVPIFCYKNLSELQKVIVRDIAKQCPTVVHGYTTDSYLKRLKCRDAENLEEYLKNHSEDMIENVETTFAIVCKGFLELPTC